MNEINEKGYYYLKMIAENLKAEVRVEKRSIYIIGQEFEFKIFNPDRYFIGYSFYITILDEIGFFLEDMIQAVSGEALLNEFNTVKASNVKKGEEEYLTSCLVWIFNYLIKYEFKLNENKKIWIEKAIEIAYGKLVKNFPMEAKNEYRNAIKVLRSMKC